MKTCVPLHLAFFACPWPNGLVLSVDSVLWQLVLVSDGLVPHRPLRVFLKLTSGTAVEFYVHPVL